MGNFESHDQVLPMSIDWLDGQIDQMSRQKADYAAIFLQKSGYSIIQNTSNMNSIKSNNSDRQSNRLL